MHAVLSHPRALNPTAKLLKVQISLGPEERIGKVGKLWVGGGMEAVATCYFLTLALDIFEPNI